MTSKILGISGSLGFFVVWLFVSFFFFYLLEGAYELFRIDRSLSYVMRIWIIFQRNTEK